MAGVLNFVGALSGTAVATTVGKGIVSPEVTTQVLVASALVAAIVWNLLTWYLGLPSSSSHALIFSLVGAGVATAGWSAIEFAGLEKTFQGLVFSPVLGFAAAFAIMVVLLNLFARAFPATVTHVFGRAQLLSAAYMAFSHGSNDAQKTMGVITMALASYWQWGGSDWAVPAWVIVAAARGHGPGHVDRRLADHSYDGPARRAAAPDPRFRGRDRRGHGDRSGEPTRNTGVDHTHHQLRDHGRGLDAPTVGGALGRGRPDRHRLGADHSGLLPAGLELQQLARPVRRSMTPRPREHVARLKPYEWEAMASEVAAAAGIAEADVVRFDTNTTPWPPVAWEQTVLDVPRLAANEYPHPSNEPLRSALAERLGVAADQVVVTCGADEALFLIASVYLGPGRLAVVADPAFSMFRVVSESVGASMLPVAVDADWDVPREALLEAVRDARVGVAWLCHPKQPDRPADFAGAGSRGTRGGA